MLCAGNALDTKATLGALQFRHKVLQLGVASKLNKHYTSRLMISLIFQDSRMVLASSQLKLEGSMMNDVTAH